MAATVEHLETSQDVGGAVASIIADGIADAAAAGRRYVLCAPSGRTPLATFSALARIVEQRRLPLAHVTISMLDEYLQQDASGAFSPVADDLPYSCTRWGVAEIVEPLNAAGPASPLARDQLLVPDAADPAGYEARLQQLGGFDLLMLASGTSDGHVAFNPQGTPAEAATRIIPLAHATRQDNLLTFPTFRSLDEVPRFGVTIGPGTMRRLAKRAVMVITGEEKREAAVETLSRSTYDPAWPASIIHDCQQASVLVDSAAAPVPATSQA